MGPQAEDPSSFIDRGHHETVRRRRGDPRGESDREWGLPVGIQDDPGVPRYKPPSHTPWRNEPKRPVFLIPLSPKRGIYSLIYKVGWKPWKGYEQGVCTSTHRLKWPIHGNLSQRVPWYLIRMAFGSKKGSKYLLRYLNPPGMLLGLPSMLVVSASFFLKKKKHPKHWGNSARFLKRTMVKKNGKSTLRMLGCPFLQFPPLQVQVVG